MTAKVDFVFISEHGSLFGGIDPALARKTRRFPQLEARGTDARGRDDAGLFINEHVFASRWRR